MNSLNNRTVGWITIAAGICAVIGTLALFLFLGTSGISGFIGDIAFALTSVLMIPLFITLGNMTMTSSKILGRTIQVLGVLGSLSRLVGLILLISGILEFEKSALWENFGFGLIGIAILIYALQNRNNPDLRRGYVWFSIVIGIALTFNFVGLFYADMFNEVLNGSKSFTEANPVVMVLLITAAPISVLGPPIWLLWTGRLFLKRTEAAVDLQVSTQ